MKSNYLIAIVGATAIGKTALSILLAEHFKTEIISSDSRQFFKEMYIGTAIPNVNELSQIKHHFIHDHSIFNNYNVGEFEREAIAKLNDLFKKHQIVIMVGGSGLYTDAVLNGLDDFPDVNPQIRLVLKSDLRVKGIEFLQEKLKKLDFKAYQKIDIDNKQRLIRALEICIGTGKPFSSFLKNKIKKRNFISIKIGIKAEREIIYNRINQRVDIMMQSGLLEEAKELYKHKHLNALQTVGYKELFNYLDGNYSLDFAISEIKKNTRRFAKRQITWFKKDNDIEWFDYQHPLHNIVTYIDKRTEL